MKKYKLKIVLGKRSYRSGPTNAKMKSKLNEKDGHGALKVKRGKKGKAGQSAAYKRLKVIGQKLGS